ncbi:MAG: hypothetical protein CMF22_12875 [Idiomarinaceae bacterium]|nr:hypothetical protein [Idiomarinaceae bacterium]HCV04113.1 hypothetical protein [Pseudoalteromonas sp.]
MYRPREVDQAVIAIWVSLGISVASSIISKWMNYLTEGYFVFYVVFYGLFCLLPYHIGRGSNAARWIYTGLSAFGLVLFLGLGFADMPPPEVIASIIGIPLTIFTIVRLFQERARDWFEVKRRP